MRRANFKFLNNVTSMEGYQAEVASRWMTPITGRPMLYGNLMGKANDNLYGIDIATMGEGPQLSNEKEWMLETHVNESETVKALKDIGDLKTLV
ncbi:hypothetical protein KIW84_061265 [Lathyrus oleraceus]|nr:hypothetical protein KIW84_061265 [Pisum sativum]